MVESMTDSGEEALCRSFSVDARFKMVICFDDFYMSKGTM